MVDDSAPSAEPKAYRFIPIYATDAEKADPKCWSVMTVKPSPHWIANFIVEELF